MNDIFYSQLNGHLQASATVHFFTVDFCYRYTGRINLRNLQYVGGAIWWKCWRQLCHELFLKIFYILELNQKSSQFSSSEATSTISYVRFELLKHSNQFLKSTIMSHNLWAIIYETQNWTVIEIGRSKECFNGKDIQILVDQVEMEVSGASQNRISKWPVFEIKNRLVFKFLYGLSMILLCMTFIQGHIGSIFEIYYWKS